jgi:TRAP-type C4-dicarboxylate transport system permease small subunit
MDPLALRFYRALLALSCAAMVASFVTVALGIVARAVNWDIPGLDAYAGYAIAAALFLALPATLLQGEHIRVTLVLERVPPRLRAALEWWGLAAGATVSLYLAYFAVRMVWVSYTTHDTSPGGDASPLWIPQLAMALGCAGFALALVHALVARLRGSNLIAVGDTSHSE